MNDESRMYKEARQRVKKKKDFYGHLTTYVIVGIFFFVLNMLTSPFNWWFYWPMLGWGIGLASHYFSAFGLPGTEALNDEWEEQEIQREIRRLEYRNRRPQHASEEEMELNDWREQERKVRQQREEEERRQREQEEKIKRRDWDDSELV